MKDEELFMKHAGNYIICYNEQCERRGQCLRWIMKDYVPESQLVITVINPRYKNKNGAECESFKSNEKRRMAIGMTKLYDDMPRKVEQHIRRILEKHFGHTMYFLYRKGDRLITPEMQEYIKKVCVRCGWNEEPVYDGFTEEYEW